jgi:Spy/CpxP family protein refolding chaperone
MTMNRRLKTILVIFSVAMNLGFSVFAVYFYIVEKNEGKEGLKAHGQDISFYQKLGLSEAQDARVQHLVREYARGQIVLKRQNRNLEQDLLTILMEKDIDRARAIRTLDEIASLKRAREEMTFEHLLAVKGVLTEEQARKMFKMLLRQAEKGRE